MPSWYDLPYEIKCMIAHHLMRDLTPELAQLHGSGIYNNDTCEHYWLPLLTVVGLSPELQDDAMRMARAMIDKNTAEQTRPLTLPFDEPSSDRLQFWRRSRVLQDFVDLKGSCSDMLAEYEMRGHLLPWRKADLLVIERGIPGEEMCFSCTWERPPSSILRRALASRRHKYWRRFKRSMRRYGCGWTT